MGVQENSKQKQHGLSLKGRYSDCFGVPGAYRPVCCCMSWRKQGLMEWASEWFPLMLEWQGVVEIKRRSYIRTGRRYGWIWNAGRLHCVMQWLLLPVLCIVLFFCPVDTTKEFFLTSPDSCFRPVPVPHCVLEETQQARRSWTTRP